jgi:hypothetical protein
MKRLALILVLLFCFRTYSQTAANSFPRATIQFLDTELPLMEAAIAAKDSVFFRNSKVRMQSFLESWGLGKNSPELEAFPACTNATTDYLIVGLCKISPPGTICEPTTFIPKFEKSLSECRLAAKP